MVVEEGKRKEGRTGSRGAWWLRKREEDYRRKGVGGRKTQ